MLVVIAPVRTDRRRPARAGTQGVSGVPSGPANAAGLNNSGNDPSGAGNSAKIATRPATNTQGTTRRTPRRGAAGRTPPRQPVPGRRSSRKSTFLKWLGQRAAGAQRTLDGCLEYLGAAVVSHRNVISWPGETRPFGSNPVGDEAGVPLGFHFGCTIVPHEIMGGQVPSEVKEKSPHRFATRGWFGRSEITEISRGCDRRPVGSYLEAA
jgi:hypothetical protein